MNDAIGGRSFRLRTPWNPRHLLADLRLLFQRNRDGQYVLNNRQNRLAALRACYLKATDHVEMVARYADGSLMSLSRGHNLKTNSGIDLQSHMTNGDSSTGTTGTSTATGATSLTDSGASWTTNQYANHIVYTGSVYAVILSNSGTVLTLDKWYTVASPGGAAASTPSTGVYIIGPAVAPAQWIGLTTDSAAASATDTTLPSELNTNGVSRSFATFAHTNGTTTATLSKTFTATGNVGIVAKAGCFNAANNGVMYTETLLNATANLASNGDNVAITWTFTHS